MKKSLVRACASILMTVGALTVIPTVASAAPTAPVLAKPTFNIASDTIIQIVVSMTTPGTYTGTTPTWTWNATLYSKSTGLAVGGCNASLSSVGSLGYCTVTGLTAGSTYYATVSAYYTTYVPSKANSDIGTATSNDVRIPVLPSAPNVTSVTPTTNGLGARFCGNPTSTYCGNAGWAKSVTVTWTAPADDGGLPVTGYTVTAVPKDTYAPFCTGTQASGPCYDQGQSSCTTTTALSCDVPNLTPGANYDFTVTAKTAKGSTVSPVFPSMIKAIPSFVITTSNSYYSFGPGVVNATNPIVTAGDGWATLTWNAGNFVANGYPITSYIVSATQQGGYSWSGPGATCRACSYVPLDSIPSTVTVVGTCVTINFTCTISGLHNGESYGFIIQAVNALGTGPIMMGFQANPVGIPHAVSNIITQVGKGSFGPALSVNWTQPDNWLTAPGIGYYVSIQPTGRSTIPQNWQGNTSTELCSVQASPPSSQQSTNVNNIPWLTPYTPVPTNCSIPIQSAPRWPGDNAFLTPGTSYNLVISACNWRGCAQLATSPVVIPAPVKVDAPASAATTPASTQLTVNWTPAATAGASQTDSYLVVAVPAGTAVGVSGLTSPPSGYCRYTVTTPEVDSCVITGLTNGTKYDVYVVPKSSMNGNGTMVKTSGIPGGPPSVPLNPSATAGTDSLIITWSAPTSNGGIPITSYTATAYDALGNVAGSCTYLATNPESNTCTITGLMAGPYTTKIVATNAAGNSPEATTAPAAPIHATAPGAPLSASATGGQLQATISWTPSTDDGGSPITSYTAELLQNGVVIGSCVYTVTLPETDTCTVNGVPEGDYDVRVTATNVVGASSSTTTTVTVLPNTSAPSAPLNPSATSNDDGQTTVTWSAPTDDGGSPVTSYTATAYDSTGAEIGSCTYVVGEPETDSCVITGLTNAVTYSVEVVATNSAGESVSSAKASGRPARVPDAPDAVTVTDGEAGQTTVMWDRPLFNGGQTITSYTATAYDSNGTAVASCTYVVTNPDINSCVITGLTNGLDYTIRVTAQNSLGTSPAAEALDLATPTSVPGAPTSVHATGGIQTATISWTPPTDDGGSVITSYTVNLIDNFGNVVGTCTYVVTSPEVDQCTVENLLGNEYRVEVTANNALGGSDFGTTTVIVVEAATVPSTPPDVSVTPGDNQVVVTWSPSVDDGGAAITSYTATAYDANGNVVGTCTYVVSAPESDTCTITNLPANQIISVAVVATNSVGDSIPGTASSTGTTTGVPNEPALAPTPLVVSESSVRFTWTPSVYASSQSVTSYTVTVFDVNDNVVGQCTYTVAIPETDTCVVTGLTPGQTYIGSVIAHSVAGDSPESPDSVEVIPAGAPDAPQSPAVDIANGRATITWAPPVSDHGAIVTSYSATLYGPTGTVLGTCTYTVSVPESDRCVVTGVTTTGAVTVKITATNRIGTSVPSAAAIATRGAFSCPMPKYVVTVDGKTFASSNLTNWSSTTSASSVMVNAMGIARNGFAYSIGAFGTSLGHLVRLDRLGNRLDLGVITGLPRNVVYLAGDIDQSVGNLGTLYVSAGARASKVYAVDIARRTATVVATPGGFVAGLDLVVLHHGGNTWIFSITTTTINGFSVGAGQQFVTRSLVGYGDANLIGGVDGNSLVAFRRSGKITQFQNLFTNRMQAIVLTATLPGAASGMNAGINVDGALCVTGA